MTTTTTTTMTKHDLEFELNEQIDEAELEQLLATLDNYTVDLPSSEEINRTIDSLQAYVPARKKTERPKVLKLLARASSEISFMSNQYWAASAGLFLAGFLVVLLNQDFVMKGNHPYMLAILFSPIPFVLGVMEVFKGREEGVMELELSCKISISEVILSRLVILCVYNIMLNSLLSGFLVFCSSGIVFWKITLLWLTPFTMIAGISLLVVTRIRGSYIVTVFAAAWMIVCISILSQEKVMNRIMQVNLWVYEVLTLSGIILLGVQMVRFAQRQQSFFERSVLNEIKN